jgi:hypothetical protein
MNLMGRPRTYHPDRSATSAERQRVFARKRAEELQQLRQKLAEKVYHKSKKHDWETPWPVFREDDAEFHFTLDVCATAETAKCARYFTPDMDGLAQDWTSGSKWTIFSGEIEVAQILALPTSYNTKSYLHWLSDTTWKVSCNLLNLRK